MTHRVFSRNASSSRAIPTGRMINSVRNDPAMPINWGKNKSGMQADEETIHKPLAITTWEIAAEDAANHAGTLSEECALHKQVANRLLEPFLHIKVIVTATEWDNFFSLRAHSCAQPEIQELARVMKEAMMNSTPRDLGIGEWHLPYVEFKDFEDNTFGNEYLPIGKINHDLHGVLTTNQAIKCSVARCARVSYLNHDNSTPDINNDINLADRLLKDGHMSPFEHQATPMKYPEGYDISCLEYESGITHMDRYGSLWSGNFRGWRQYRHLI